MIVNLFLKNCERLESRLTLKIVYGLRLAANFKNIFHETTQGVPRNMTVCS